MMPVTGCHSVMERPEPVSRVSPPTTTIRPIIAAIRNSQSPTARSVRARLVEGAEMALTDIALTLQARSIGPSLSKPRGIVQAAKATLPSHARSPAPGQEADRHDGACRLAAALCAR